jgi:hypothetical protein
MPAALFVFPFNRCPWQSVVWSCFKVIDGTISQYVQSEFAENCSQRIGNGVLL